MNEGERYKSIFDTIGTDTEITADTLASRRHEKKAARVRKTTCGIAALAVFFLGSNMVSYAKDGEFWITRFFNIHTASGIEVSIDEKQLDESSYSTMVTFNTDNQKDFFEVAGDRLYFIYDGARTDITEQCDDDRYFKHEYTDSEGYRHILIVGGTPETAGSMEYVLDEKGACIFSNTSGAVPFGDVDLSSMKVSLSENRENVDVFTEDQAAELERLKQKLEEKTGEKLTAPEEVTEDTYYFSDESYDPMENAPNWLKNAEKDLNILY